tara:strand:- start:1130 stop:2347 length:1218 start_codon:yes stop_codon:yes gene_type:complete
MKKNFRNIILIYKFLNIKLINLFLYLLSKFLFIILFFKKLSIVIIREDRIGHQVGTLDCELYLATERKNKFKINTIFLFIEPYKNVSNKYFRDITEQIVNSFGFKSRIFFSKTKPSFIQKLINNIPKNKYFYKSSITFTKHLKKPIFDGSNTSNDIMKNLKIKRERYICIYSRDKNYLKNKYPELNWEYHNYRNSDIDNLRSVSNFITNELNLEVVRIGSNPEKKLKWGKKIFPKIVDYSFTKYQNEKNDINLISSCCFYISNGGGPESIAIASRKRMIRINQAPIIEEIGYEFGIYIPKLLRRVSDNKYISINKAIELGISQTYKNSDFIKNGIYCEENSEIDILNAFKDYIKYEENKFNMKEQSIINKYMILRRKNEIAGLILSGFNNFIAPSFLLKYPDLLN